MTYCAGAVLKGNACSFLFCGSAELAQFIKRSSVDSRALPLCLGPKRIAEWFHFNDVGALLYFIQLLHYIFFTNTDLAQIGVGSIVQECHGQFIPPQKDRIRVVFLRRQTRPKMVQRSLRDYPRISYPNINIPPTKLA